MDTTPVFRPAHRSDTLSRNLARGLLCSSLIGVLAACGQSDTGGEDSAAAPEIDPTSVAAQVAEAMPDAEPVAGSDALSQVLNAQSEEAKARFDQRNPKQTLEFFGIEPGMTVLEGLPGGGWYSKILIPYLGIDGTLVGVDYDKDLFPLFGFYSAEALAAKDTWPDDWRAEASAWFAAPVADIDAFQFGSLPERLEGEVDAVLMVRALHNLARFESEGRFLTEALADMQAALKPGGIVGIVQHMAPESAPDDWADGSAGYLKKSYVMERMQAAGFEFVAETSINENPLDQPSTEEVVWRLPPGLSTSRDDPELAARYKAIGESSRMTLLFKKAG